MPGTKGQSGGRNRLSPAEHLRRGTFQRCRHGSREAAAQALAFPVATNPLPPIPSHVLAGLGPRGAAFATELWNNYAFTPATIESLRVAAEQVDRRAEARAALAHLNLAATDDPAIDRWLTIEQRATRNYVDVMRHLNLER